MDDKTHVRKTDHQGQFYEQIAATNDEIQKLNNNNNNNKQIIE